MTKDDSKGFEFNDVEDSDIGNNSASGFNKGFEVNRSKRIKFNYNTADKKSRAVLDRFVEIHEDLSDPKTLFGGKDELQELIEGVVEGLNSSSPRKGVLNSLGQSINSVLTGAIGGIISSEYPELLNKIKDAVVMLQDLV
jgi:hypothetical protein